MRNDPIRNTDSLGLVDFDFKVIRNTGGPHGGNNTGDWGSPGWAFKSSSFTYDLTSATSTIIGKGPARSACCNTVIGSGADNTAAGSFDVIMYNAEVGNWEVALEYIADLSILGGKKGDNAQASNRFMRGLFNPPLLWGNITLQSSDGTVVGPTWYGANPQVYLAYEYFSNPGERRTISSYGVTVNFNHCGPITVTAVGTINVLYWNKIN